MKSLSSARPISPWLGFGDSLDLFVHSHHLMAEKAAEPVEAIDLIDVEGFAMGHLPQPLDVERELSVVSAHPASIHAQLAQVEEDAVVEMTLIDVVADLALVSIKDLRRALRVENEAVRDQVDRREIGLQPAPPKLRKVRILGKAQHPLDEILQDGLRQQLLVFATAGPRQVLPEVSRAVQLPIPPRLLFKERRQLR